MNKVYRFSNRLHLTLVIATTGLVLLAMIACESPRQGGNKASLVGSTPTSTQVQNPLAATKQAFDEQQQQLANQMRTADILSHVPTHEPGPPPTYTPGIPPTDTPVLGIQPCPGQPKSSPYILKDCWGGIVDGQIIYVGVGGYTHQWVVSGKDGSYGWDGDDTQGVVKLYLPNDETYVYNTPIKLGEMGILTATGNLLTLAQVDPNDPRYVLHNGQFITFDVATRQFTLQFGTPVATTPGPRP